MWPLSVMKRGNRKNANAFKQLSKAFKRFQTHLNAYYFFSLVRTQIMLWTSAFFFAFAAQQVCDQFNELSVWAFSLACKVTRREVSCGICLRMLFQSHLYWHWDHSTFIAHRRWTVCKPLSKFGVHTRQKHYAVAECFCRVKFYW